MASQQDILEERNEDLEEKKFPMTQYLVEGVVNDEAPPEDFYGFPVSCRFKYCKGIMENENEVRQHQIECHTKKAPSYALSCKLCAENKTREKIKKRRAFVQVDGFKKHLITKHPSINQQVKEKCPCCLHVIRKPLPKNAKDMFEAGKKWWERN